MGEVSTIERAPRAIDEARQQLQTREEQFKVALPAHMPVERFMRVVDTTLQNSPMLLKCNRASLFNACMRAAQDGLLPDGREGAIVPYKNKAGDWIAQWLPMIGGLRKKAFNSGEISKWETAIVYENDAFDYELGDAPFIRHKPTLGERGKIIAAYSIATLKDGSISREVMSIGDIEGVRSKSKAQKGPWDDPIFYPEMVRKTVARRHSKALPMSTDLETAIERDDELYDLGAREQTKERHGGKPTLSGALDTLAKLPAPSPVAEPPKDATPSETIDEETGEVIETPVVETLLKEIEALPTLEACSEWQWQTSEKYGDLHPDDAKKIHKAMLAHQSKLLKKGRKGDAA